ncbi:MAG: polyphosphate polymerase domain-containing protein [Ruminococcaceae bacterium]|nr:polyphosphate polymerase domain-containing protein [Oscillospiraceae bacterium]
MKENFGFVFQRYEKKYLLTEDKYHNLCKDLSGYMQTDKYGLTTICNIYYDTSDFRLIRTSLEKPRYKEKFRVRSYGVPQSDSDVFLEIKKKYKNVVYKRRAVMTHEQSLKYLSNNIKPYDSQIMREIDYFFRLYELSPSVFLAYDRIAMFGIQDPELRMTFDTNIRSRFHDLNLAYGDSGELLIDNEAKYLLEIKTLNSIPLWLTRILSKNEVYPTSFSKYGRVYEKHVNKVNLDHQKENCTYV